MADSLVPILTAVLTSRVVRTRRIARLCYNDGLKYVTRCLLVSVCMCGRVLVWYCILASVSRSRATLSPTLHFMRCRVN